MTSIKKAIEASSLGTTQARAHRRRVPPATAALIVAASKTGRPPAIPPKKLGGKP